jgi:hypothetical protein
VTLAINGLTVPEINIGIVPTITWEKTKAHTVSWVDTKGSTVRWGTQNTIGLTYSFTADAIPNTEVQCDVWHWKPKGGREIKWYGDVS